MKINKDTSKTWFKSIIIPFFQLNDLDSNVSAAFRALFRANEFKFGISINIQHVEEFWMKCLRSTPKQKSFKFLNELKSLVATLGEPIRGCPSMMPQTRRELLVRIAPQTFKLPDVKSERFSLWAVRGEMCSRQSLISIKTKPEGSYDCWKSLKRRTQIYFTIKYWRKDSRTKYKWIRHSLDRRDPAVARGKRFKY